LFQRDLHSRSKFPRRAFAADVREVYFRLIVEKMIVQGGDAQACVERRVITGFTFVLHQNKVAHDHRRGLIALGKGSPRSQPMNETSSSRPLTSARRSETETLKTFDERGK
jgi:hypothetical protein